MRGLKAIVFLLIWSLAAIAAEESPIKKKDLNDSITPRLSWAPYEFLRQGFRNAPWVNDPFYPESRMLKVSGIVSDTMAFINGKWFKLGDKIEGYTVKKIAMEGVLLARENEMLMLKVKD